MEHLLRSFLPLNRRNPVPITFVVAVITFFATIVGFIANTMQVIQVSWFWFILAIIVAIVFAIVSVREIELSRRKAEKIEKLVRMGRWLKDIDGRRTYEWVSHLLKDRREEQKVKSYRVSMVSPVPECQQEKIESDDMYVAERVLQTNSTIRLPSTLIIGVGYAGQHISKETLRYLELITGRNVKAVTSFFLDPVEHARSRIPDNDLVGYVEYAEKRRWKRWLIPPCFNMRDPQNISQVIQEVSGSRKYGRFLFAADKEKAERSFVRELETYLQKLRNIHNVGKMRKQGEKLSLHSNVIVVASSDDNEASGMFVDILHVISLKIKAMGIDRYVHLYGVVLLPPVDRLKDAQLVNIFALLEELKEVVYDRKFYNEMGEEINVLPCTQCFLVILDKNTNFGVNLASMLLADGHGVLAGFDLAPSGFSTISGYYLHFDWKQVASYLAKQDMIGVLRHALGETSEQYSIRHKYESSFNAEYQAAAFLSSIMESDITQVADRLKENIRNMASNGVALVDIIRFLDTLTDYSAFWRLKILEGDDVGARQNISSSEAVVRLAGYYAKLYKDLESKFQMILEKEEQEVNKMKEGGIYDQVKRTKRYWEGIRDNVGGIKMYALLAEFLDTIECTYNLYDLQKRLEDIFKVPYIEALKTKAILDLYDIDEAWSQILTEYSSNYGDESAYIINGNAKKILLIPHESRGFINLSEVITVPSLSPYWLLFLKMHYGLKVERLPLYQAGYNLYHKIPWLKRFFLRINPPKAEPKEMLLFALSWSLGFLAENSPGNYRWKKTHQFVETLWDAYYYLCCDQNLCENLVEELNNLRSQKGMGYIRRKIRNFLKDVEQHRLLRDEEKEVFGIVSCILENCEDRLDHCLRCLEDFSSACTFLERCLGDYLHDSLS